MPSAALDANVVIGLANGSVFNHLRSLYTPLYVPPGVTNEIVQQGQGRAGVAELTLALGTWIAEVTPSPTVIQQLGTGPIDGVDRELLALAVEKAVDHVLSGDRVIRREATRLGLTSLSAVEVVVVFKLTHAIPAVRPVLDLMRRSGFGIDAASYLQALATAGERP